MIIADSTERRAFATSSANVIDSLLPSERHAVSFALSPVSSEIPLKWPDFTKLENYVHSAFTSAIPETLKVARGVAGAVGVNALIRTILLYETENVVGSQLTHEDVIKAKLSTISTSNRKPRGELLVQESSQESLSRVARYLTNVYLDAYQVTAEDSGIVPPIVEMPPSTSVSIRESNHVVLEPRKSIEAAIRLYLRTTPNEFKVMKNTGLPYTTEQIERIIEIVKNNDPIELLDSSKDSNLAKYLETRYVEKMNTFYSYRTMSKRRVVKMVSPESPKDTPDSSLPDDEGLLHDDLY